MTHQTNRRIDRFEIHATDIPKLCLRHALLFYIHGIPLRNSRVDIPPKTCLTFKLGEKIEDLAREAFNGVKPPPVAIRIGKIYLVGSPDIVIRNKFIIECKSIKKDYFDALTEPYEKHKAQLSFYLWLAYKYPILGYSKTGAVVYIPKEEASDVIKVFTVTLSKAYIKLYDNVLETVKNFTATKKLPERICKDTNSVFARRCPALNLCFKRR